MVFSKKPIWVPCLTRSQPSLFGSQERSATKGSARGDGNEDKRLRTSQIPCHTNVRSSRIYLCWSAAGKGNRSEDITGSNLQSRPRSWSRICTHICQNQILDCENAVKAAISLHYHPWKICPTIQPWPDQQPGLGCSKWIALSWHRIIKSLSSG